MNSDDVVLVVLLNNQRDYELAVREHWYRIPIHYAPKHFSGAQYLALYFARVFGEQKWMISEFASVRGHELVRRRDLLPDEANHPRADEIYYKLQLGVLERREPPIVSTRGRRMLFLWTTGEKFSTARELNDLFHKGPVQDKLWGALKSSNLDAEREMIVREGHARYRVDFLIFCPRGRVAVMLGDKSALRSAKSLRAVTLLESDLENHFERALAQIKQQVHELSEPYKAEVRA